MMIDEYQKKAIEEKLNFFYSEKIAVHVIKHNREFLNGNLTQKKSEGIFIIDDKKKGLVNLFVSEIFDVEEFREVGE